MKFAIKNTVAQPSKVKPTLEDAYDMQELCLLVDKAHNKVIKHVSDSCEIFASLTIADLKKSSNTLATLGKESVESLASAMNCTVAELDTMSVETFMSKTSALMPKDMVATTEPSQEEIGLVIALAAIYIALFAGLSAVASKFTKYDLPFLENDMVSTLQANAKEALSNITANTFTAAEYAKQIKGINAVLDFLSTDVKKFYDPSFKVVEIEKMARNLWMSPTTQAFAGDDASSWWEEWRDNMPKKQFGTLGELGFTVQSLVSTAKGLDDIAREIDRMGKKWGVIKNGRLEARRKADPGFFGKIKRFFTESVEDREKRKQAELILNAKYQGLRNLLFGIDVCGRAMLNDFIFIAVKTQNYLAKYEDK